MGDFIKNLSRTLLRSSAGGGNPGAAELLRQDEGRREFELEFRNKVREQVLKRLDEQKKQKQALEDKLFESMVAGARREGLSESDRFAIRKYVANKLPARLQEFDVQTTGIKPTVSKVVDAGNRQVALDQFGQEITTIAKGKDPNKGPLVVNREESEKDKLFAKLQVDRFDEIVGQGNEASRQVHQLDRMDQYLDLQGNFTGKGRKAVLALEQIAQTFGINIGDPLKIAAAEGAESLTNEWTLRLRNPEGGLGLPGNTSNKDIDFLHAIPAGIHLSPGGNRFIIDTWRRVNQYKIENAKFAEALLADDGKFSNEDYIKLQEFTRRRIFNEDEDLRKLARLRNLTRASRPKIPEPGQRTIIKDAQGNVSGFIEGNK